MAHLKPKDRIPLLTVSLKYGKKNKTKQTSIFLSFFSISFPTSSDCKAAGVS